MEDRKKFQENIPEHNPGEDGEVFPVFIPRGVRDLILEYLNYDIEMIQDEKENIKNHAKFKLFGRGLEYFKNLNEAATHILLGEEENIPEILALVKANPILLFVKAKGFDALKREVDGTLIQIAAMSGNVNLLPKIRDSNKLGLVERLQLAGNLSDDDVKAQLEMIFGNEAMEVNKKRNQLIIKRVTQFIDDILQVKVADKKDFQSLKLLCKPLAVQLEKDLFAISSKITCGYLFDLHILRHIGEVFLSKLRSFGGWYSIHAALFWINAFGLLQKNFSAKDAQITKSGLKNYIEKQIIPANKLDDYYISNLGYNHFFDYNGNKYEAKNCWVWAPENIQGMLMFDKLIENREKTLSTWVTSTKEPSFLNRFFLKSLR